MYWNYALIYHSKPNYFWINNSFYQYTIHTSIATITMAMWLGEVDQLDQLEKIK